MLRVLDIKAAGVAAPLLHTSMLIADDEKLALWRYDYNFASLRPSFYVVEENRFC